VSRARRGHARLHKKMREGEGGRAGGEEGGIAAKRCECDSAEFRGSRVTIESSRYSVRRGWWHAIIV